MIGARPAPTMLSALKALACVVFLSTVVSGSTIEDLEQFEIIAQPRGIDVSAYQPNINWTAVDSHGVSFVYIKATEGTSKLVVRSSRVVLTLHFRL